MIDKVYYQDGKVTITDKVIVTKDNTFELSSISGLSSKVHIFYVLLPIWFGLVLIVGLQKDFERGTPAIFILFGLVVLSALVGLAYLFPTRKLVANLRNGGTATLVDNIYRSRAQAIMYAFTLAKNT